MDFKKYITDVPDFPTPGILFRDLTPLMRDGKAFQAACDEMVCFGKDVKATVVVGPEARGFIFGCPISYQLGIGFVPIRKPHKLPRETREVEYSLEYGTNTLCIHADAINKGDRVLIVDDLLATGGTVRAAIELIEEAGGIVAGLVFTIELTALHGADTLKKYPLLSLVKY
jgi:adenine phosphoribosyltransferase